MSNAVAGVGTIFERYNGVTWEDIAEVTSIEGPDMDRDYIETTSLDTAAGYDEFITGFIDGGTLELAMNFTRNGFEIMKSDFELDVVRMYRITLPDEDGTMLSFEGFVIDLPLEVEADDKMEVNVSIQVTGEVTLYDITSGSGVTADTTEVTADTTVITADTTASASASYPACLDDANHWWYDATDLATITKDGSNLVSVWAAKGGAATGKNLLQDDGAKQPLWVAPGTIRFDGVDDFLKSAAFTWNQPEFIYMLVKQITWTYTDRIFDGNGNQTAALYQGNSTPKIIAYAGGLSSENSNLFVDTWGIIRVLFNGANSKLQVNDTASIPGNFGTTNAGGFTLGSRGGGDVRFSNIEVKDIVCVDIDDAANETEIYNWLVTRKP